MIEYTYHGWKGMFNWFSFDIYCTNLRWKHGCWWILIEKKLISNCFEIYIYIPDPKEGTILGFGGAKKMCEYLQRMVVLL